MANLVTPVIAPLGTSSVDDSALNPVGTIAFDKDGNEYVYGLGVASTVAGNWVTFGPDYATTRLVSASTGKVGIAMAAIVAGKYGWYQIKGWNSIALAGSNGTIVSGGGELKSEASVGGLVVLGTGDSFGVTDASHIYGAWSYSAQPDSDSAAAGTPGMDMIVVYLDYPTIQRLAASV